MRSLFYARVVLMVRAFGLLSLLAFSTSAFGHTASITHVHVETATDSINVTYQFSQGDVLHSVVRDENGRHAFADFDQLKEAAPLICSHFLSTTSVTADGETLVGTLPADWPRERFSLTQPDALGVEQATPLSLTLCYRVPRECRQISLSMRAFESSGLPSLFVVRVQRNGVLVLREVVEASQPVRFDFAGDTKAVAQTGDKTPAMAPVAASSADVGFWATLIAFASFGFTHIIPHGYDHVLFVLGLFFLNPKLRTLLTQITAFTLAHSLTLGLAVAGLVSAPPAIVEPLIAASIAFVAIENLTTRSVRPWRWAVVFAFGLVHGMGFAGALHEVGLPGGREGAALMGFNVGVELGQLAVILLLFLLTGWFRDRRWYFSRVAAPASIGIACVGAFWTVQRIFFN